MARLTLYHDFTSAFCRVALAVARQTAIRAALELDLAPVELNPAPAPLPNPGDIESELDAARPLARELDLELRLPPRVSRTRKAHEALAHARRHARAVELAEALYDAYWRSGLDIGRIDVIADVGARVGLDRDALHVDLGVDTLEAEVRQALHSAGEAGIDQVPAFRVGDQVLVGLVGVDELQAWVPRPSRHPDS